MARLEWKDYLELKTLKLDHGMSSVRMPDTVRESKVYLYC